MVRMQNAFYMKEPIANSAKIVSFVMLSQKQLKDALNFTANTYLAQQKTVVIVALSLMPAEIFKMVPLFFKKKVFVIDCFSHQDEEQDGVYYTSGPADLTSIQVALETIEKKIPAGKTIIIDAVNMLGVYNDKKTFGKFMHLLTNKMRLEDNTTILFAAKESTEEELASLVKEFSDKNYDFSEMQITSITEK